MSQLLSKILIFGVPLLLSLSWFIFWVTRLVRAGRRLKAREGSGADGRPVDTRGSKEGPTKAR